MNPILSLFFLILFTSTVFSRKVIPRAEKLIITGQVLFTDTLFMDELKNFPEYRLKKTHVINHQGIQKSVLKRWTGVRVIDMLKKIEIKTDNPRHLSEFYVKFVATDGYTVIFSWNELFNTPAGKEIFIITTPEGRDMATFPEGITRLAPGDLHTGRLYIKGCNKLY